MPYLAGPGIPAGGFVEQRDRSQSGGQGKPPGLELAVCKTY
jgi:hypothetical protein